MPDAQANSCLNEWTIELGVFCGRFPSFYGGNFSYTGIALALPNTLNGGHSYEERHCQKHEGSASRKNSCIAKLKIEN